MTVGNFANRDPEEVKKIASMGGKASHGGHGNTDVRLYSTISSSA